MLTTSGLFSIPRMASSTSSFLPSFFMLFLANDKVFSSNNTDTFPARPREVRISTLLSHQDQDRGKNNCNLVLVILCRPPGKAQQKLRCTIFRVSCGLKNVFNQILPSFLLVHKTQHTVSRSVSRCVGKLCYQRSQNLCRRFRQLCPLQVCECQDCLISPHYHTCQVSACPCWSEVLLLSPSSLFFWLVLLSISRLLLVRRPLALLQVGVVYLFAFSWTRHTINTTPCVAAFSSPDLVEEPESWEQPTEKPTLALVETCNSWICQRHSLLPGEVPPG